jgi:hypothetical protein
MLCWSSTLLCHRTVWLSQLLAYLYSKNYMFNLRIKNWKEKWFFFNKHVYTYCTEVKTSVRTLVIVHRYILLWADILCLELFYIKIQNNNKLQKLTWWNLICGKNRKSLKKIWMPILTAWHILVHYISGEIKLTSWITFSPYTQSQFKRMYPI